MLLSFAVACGLLCIPGFGGARLAQAADGDLTVSGVDFMQTQAQGWDVLKVDNLDESAAIYVTVYENGTPLSNPMKFMAKKKGQDEVKIAEIVALQMPADGKGQTVQELLGNADHATYTISVSDALMQGKDLFTGTIYPVYGKIVNSDDSYTLEIMGIRTVKDREAAGLQKNLGVGATYYKQDTTTETYPTAYSLQMNGAVDNYFDGNAFIVTYVQDKPTDIQGTINYVDISTGETVKTETVTGIDSDEGKTIDVKMSFITQDPKNENAVKYYRAVSNFDTPPTLTVRNATYTVNVIEVEDMSSGCYPVTVEYVDENDNLLWSDTIYVKGDGYRYTLPNTFSMKTYKQLTSSDGVEFYTLDKVIGGEVVDGTDIEETLTAQGVSVSEAAITTGASEGNGTAVNFTLKMGPNDFQRNEDGHYFVKAVYKSQEATKKVEFTVVEIDGETGTEIGRIQKTVTPDEGFSYVLENKTIDGKTYVPWAGNPEKIEYTWEGLGQGVDLMQYVYYVPEGYVPGDGYDITIQYMNVSNGAILRTQTLAVDPEMTGYLEFIGEESFTQDGNEYVRLDGQQSGIRHAYFSPNRTYTVYYRGPNDTPTPAPAPEPETPATIPTTPAVVPVQIIDTDVPGTGGGITAAPTAIEDAPDGAPLAEAGVAPGDGTVIINDDDNPLANLDGQDTSTERVIEENENPLAFAPDGPGGLAIAGIIASALIVIGIVAFLFLRRRKSNQENYSI